jgi:hypothetical protein
MSSTRIPFGLKDGELIQAGEVPRGDKCGVTCPGCKSPLRANQGKKKAPYFSHQPGADCTAGFETSIHLAAKQIFEEEKQVRLPGLTIFDRMVDAEGFLNIETLDVIESDTTYSLDRVEVEKSINDFRPDLIGYVNGTPLIIEVAVTHFVDDEKAEKIKKADISAIEIDLSHLPYDVDWETLKEALFDIGRGKWIYSRLGEAKRPALRKKLISVIEERRIKKEKRLRALADSEKRRRISQNVNRREAGLKNELTRKAKEEFREAQEYCLRALNHLPMLKKEFERRAHTHEQWGLLRDKLDLERLQDCPDFIDVPLQCDWIFGCDRRLWQATIFVNFVLNKFNSERSACDFSGSLIAQWLDTSNLFTVLPEVRAYLYLSKHYDVDNRIGDKIVDSSQLIASYLARLEKLGFIERSDDFDHRRANIRYMVAWDRFSLPPKYDPPTLSYGFIDPVTAIAWQQDDYVRAQKYIQRRITLESEYPYSAPRNLHGNLRENWLEREEVTGYNMYALFQQLNALEWTEILEAGRDIE